MPMSHDAPGVGGTGLPSGVSTPRLTLDAVSGPPLNAIHPRIDKPTVLGRSGQSDVIMGDESVSRRHCSISPRQGMWFIEDMGSRHGTYVQSAKLAEGQSMPLKNGDMIGIGPWLLRARIGEGVASVPGQRLVTLMGGGPSTAGLGASRAGGTGAGGAPGAAALKERVERVQERELAALNQNRLKLLIDVAAAVAGSGSEEALARTIVEAAVQGTGFPRAFMLRDETVHSADAHAPVAPGAPDEAGPDTLRIIYEVDPDAIRTMHPAAASPTPAPGKPGSPQAEAGTSPRFAPSGEMSAAPSFSRSLIAAARKGEVVRLTSDAPMQAVSIMALGIQTALCAPITIDTGAGPTVCGFLYLDSRSGEKQGPKTHGAVMPAAAGASGVHSDAAAFCSALAKMYSLAVGNLARLELEQRQRELVRDMEAASEAQKLIMPPPQGKIGRVRYAMRSKSGRYVAGDLFDVVDLEDGRVGVLLGDVAGKGVPAAILMATAQTHLHVALREGRDVSRAVTAVNKHICEHMASNKFISLWIGIFDPAAGTISYVDAGHGYWLLTRHDGPPLRSVSATGIPLGIDPTFHFEVATLKIEPGQRLVVFSDGVVEQPGGGQEGGEQFGVERAIQAIAGSSGEGQDVDRIFAAVLGHAKGPNLADDTTVASVVVE